MRFEFVPLAASCTMACQALHLFILHAIAEISGTPQRQQEEGKADREQAEELRPDCVEPSAPTNGLSLGLIGLRFQEAPVPD